MKSQTIFLIGFALLIIALSPGRLISSDAGTRLLASRYLWSEGTVFIPVEKERKLASQLIDPTGKGKWVSYFGIGQTLLFIPFDMLGHLISKFSSGSPARKHHISWLPIVFLYPVVIAVLLVFFLQKMLRLYGFSNRSAMFGALCFLSTTILLPYLTQTVQEEGVVALFVTLAWFALVQWKRTQTASAFFWCGLFAGACLLCRLNAIFAMIPLAAGFVETFWYSKNRKDLLTTVPSGLFGFGIMFFIYCTFAYWRFGHPLSTGYYTMHHAGTFLSHARDPVGPVRLDVAYDMLFGIGKGLFILSPTLFLSFFAFRRLSRKDPLFWSSVIFALVLSVLFHSRFIGFPDGSECWGTRYQVHILVYFVVPMLIGLHTCWKLYSTRVAAMAFIVFGIAVQMLSMSGPDALEYVQAAEEGKGYESLLSGWQYGQLPARIRNVVHAVKTRKFSLSDTTEKNDEGNLIQVMASRYIPNLWGPMFAKRSSTAYLGRLAVLAWMVCLIASLVLLVRSFVGAFPSRKRTENALRHSIVEQL